MAVPERGVEVMAVHSEVDTLQESTSRPLHLRNFTPDWVGKPGISLNEAAKLQPRTVSERSLALASGVYNMGAGLPPVFAQKAEERKAMMIGARATRDAAVEMLRLTYVAARRENRRIAVANRAAQRLELQGLSGQPLSGTLSANPTLMSGQLPPSLSVGVTSQLPATMAEAR